MNLKTRLNNIKTRFKAASKAFLDPIPTLSPKVFVKTVEPSVVLDNQLLAGKNVLITGAARNIGRSIAIEMAKQGANIIFTDIIEEGCLNLEKELNTYPVQVRGFVSDISKPEDIDYLYSILEENKIIIDILVNNVGIQFETVGINNLELGEWQKTFQTNVFGPMCLTKLISQMMVSNSIHGSLIFITSIHQDSVVRWPSYSSSKAALGMIIKELAVDLASYGIRVNGIAPSWVVEDEQKQPLSIEYSLLHGCSISPCYIGRAAVYLGSDYFSKFTTGTVLKIDGGTTLYNYRVAQNPPQ
ncbi:SDR family NAD(P)-dependent oxidoreductase [Trichormus variabilis]|uniref:Beta-ketoacyl-ACP reductase n=1 Tax=Trichormus variabilis SAG 1403-4b TaxID=447716 RepID=A0A3S1CB11_ANAVA|nr:SDR family oxidoreductase [Trichormus variabilis]MBD2627213.1 SDR family oxidoreductase [Trichormus variabilis FACHB-164]RUS99992.1 beta-ketoacyl-ACP reductase [Trichormus variabilis SAG 1403-4b]